MADEVTLVRPDGSLVTVDSDKAKHLTALGYRPESDDEAFKRNVQAGQEEYYTSTAQQIKTGLEGIGSGLTLGLSDIALEGMGADTAERARHNPGIRMGAEVVGGLLPIAPGGVGKFFTMTPAGLVSKAATAAAGAAASPMARGAIGGVVEGAGMGLQQEVAHKTLTGDPLTVEGALAGMGWGALFGGGLGGMIGGVQGKVEGAIAKRAEAEALEKAGQVKAAQEGQKDLLNSAIGNEKWAQFQGTLKEAGVQAEQAVKLAREHMESTVDVYAAVQRDAAAKHAANLTGNLDEISAGLKDIRSNYLNSFIREGKLAEKGVKEAHTAAIKAHDRLKKALKAKDYEAIQELKDEFEEAISSLHSKTGSEVGMEGGQATSYATAKPSLPPMQRMDPRVSEAATLPDPEIMLKAEASTRAYQELADLGLSGQVLKTVSSTPKAFAQMGTKRLEDLSAGLERFMGNKSAEFAGLRDSIKLGMEQMAEHVGVQLEGSISEQLRTLHSAMKGQTRAAAVKAATESAQSGKTPWWKSQVKQAAGRQSSEAMGQYWNNPAGKSMAYGVGSHVVGAILALKTGVLGAISSQALKFAPHVLKGAALMRGRVEPLLMRLDGIQDEKADRAELMKRRAKELFDAAPAVRDTLYKSISPMTVEHPEFAAATHAQAVKQFQFLLNKAPKDPGHAFNRMKSLWRPDPVATEKFARYYEVFQNPVAVINRALETMNITPEAAEGLQEMWPALFTHTRVAMIERLAEPGILDSLDYQAQVRLSTLLDLRIHSSMSPRFISQQQQMFVQRQELMPMPPQPGAEGGQGGRPSGPANSPYASAGQKVTAR